MHAMCVCGACGAIKYPNIVRDIYANVPDVRRQVCASQLVLFWQLLKESVTYCLNKTEFSFESTVFGERSLIQLLALLKPHIT